MLEFTSSKKVALSIKKLFRDLLKERLYVQSNLLSRALSKPRGYPGDYLTLELNYSNKPISGGEGKYFDTFFLQNRYAIAVKNRKNKMKSYLKDFVSKSRKSGKDKVHIVNVGCGSAREITEFIKDGVPKDIKIEFTCIDFDEMALKYAKTHQKKTPANVTVNYEKKDLVAMLRDLEFLRKYKGKVDMVYSIGLTDYFLDTVLEKLVSFCNDIVRKGGKIILAHKDIDRDFITPLCFDWFADWRFIPRNEKKMLDIVKNVGIRKKLITVERERTGIVFFVQINK